MVQSQLLDNPLAEADLSVSEADYFGAPLWKVSNSSRWPFDPDDGPLTRTSYVYQAVYKIGSGDNSQYGGIQLRARVHTYGEPPRGLRKVLSETAHRAAYMYDSGIETAGYAPPGQNVRGTSGGDGYLSGFNAVEDYTNVEQERISPGEMQTDPGVVDWSTEVYTDDSFNDADLSGIAQGLSYPFSVEHRSEGGEPAVSVAPHKWELTYNDARGMYDVHPPGFKAARRRYRPGGAGHDKTVYINGKAVGGLDGEGRTWLDPKYGGNPKKASGSWGTYWSRHGLIEETGATPQALSDGGTLYLTGETENAIHLVTAREKPAGYEPVDPDSVSESLEVKEGRDSRDYLVLVLRDPDEPLRCECRRDDKKIKHLGKSRPTYTHHLGGRQRWRADA